MAENNNLYKSFTARGIAGLQKLTASHIRTGLAFAEILDSTPKYAHASVVQAMGELIQQAGYEPFTWPEAVLLAQLSTRHRELIDPAKVDLKNPAVQQLNRELGDIFRGYGDRIYQRAIQENN